MHVKQNAGGGWAEVPSASNTLQQSCQAHLTEAWLGMQKAYI